MSKMFVLFIQFVLIIIQATFVPLWYLLSLFIPSIRKRIIFENTKQGKYTEKVDVLFEVSSQGELEQIGPILHDTLKEGKVVQLIYSSPSLNSDIKKLSGMYPSTFYWLRLPLLTYFPIRTPFTSNVWSWSKGEVLNFCRYDFFPELLLWSFFHRARLFSGTLKNKKLKNVSGFYLRGVFSLFENIFTASDADLKRYKELGYLGKVEFFDFRQIQIIRRLKIKCKKLKILEDLLQETPITKRVVIGSCWPVEMDILSDRGLVDSIVKGEMKLVLAPHVLSSDFIENIVKKIKDYAPELSPLFIEDDGRLVGDTSSNIIISKLKGVLCETYTLFGHAFVGGGHGRSVHSLLEPYLAGCRVYCGPKIHRSTEYDILMSESPEQIHIVEQLKEMYQTLMKYIENPIVSNSKDKRAEAIQDKYKILMGELNVR
ncbi:MAG: hypothetical protein KC493_13780 [Bacteriovoracaceae bacterium]|nr:hypothetical protein [Bacteriovoracaceae bacterium]